MRPARSNVSDSKKLLRLPPFFDTAWAGTRQGGYERAFQRGLDGLRSNAEDSWEEGEGSNLAEFLTAARFL